MAGLYRRDVGTMDMNHVQALGSVFELMLGSGATTDDWENFVEDAGGYATLLHALAANLALKDRCSLEKEINFLLSKGHSLNDRDSRGMTPLLLASERLDFEQVQTWIRTGSEVGSSDELGRDSLQIAAGTVECLYACQYDRKQLRDILKLLLSAGSDPNHTDESGRTTSMYMRHNLCLKTWTTWISVLNETKMMEKVNLENKLNNVREILVSSLSVLLD